MTTSGPIGDDELEGLFSWLVPQLPLTLAVSGGVDSMALMHLVVRWLRGRAEMPDGPASTLTVVTVDHRLRAASCDEARFVKREAVALGLRHETLNWTGQKPQSGIQDAARKARYRLITAFLNDSEDGALHRQPAVVTAHHLDDQGETLLMRLARGSGIDGLGGMARRSQVGDLEILRPLLDLPKCRLMATLEAAGHKWVEDPSNHNEAFERIRIRQAAPLLEKLGIGNVDLARSARRLREAREGLDFAVSQLGRSAGLDHNDGAYASLDYAQFHAAPRALRVRLLQRLIEAHGGQVAPARLSKVEVLADRFHAEGAQVISLGGCLIGADQGGQSRLLVRREAGRAGFGLPKIELLPGQSKLWDRRFTVSLAVNAPSAMTVRALPSPTYTELRRHFDQPDVPRSWAARTLPSFWRGDKLYAVPQLAAYDAALCPADSDGQPLATAQFLGDQSG